MSALSECRLYGIIDLGYVEGCDAARIVEQMVEGGVDLIQLRGKNKSIGELADLAAELHGAPVQVPQTASPRICARLQSALRQMDQSPDHRLSSVSLV